jgi:hypothetical protein
MEALDAQRPNLSDASQLDLVRPEVSAVYEQVAEWWSKTRRRPEAHEAAGNAMSHLEAAGKWIGVELGV